VPRALRLDPRVRDLLPHVMVQMEQVRRRAWEFDVLHFHVDLVHFPVFRELRRRTLTTLHGRLDLPDLVPFYAEFGDMPLASISRDQHRYLPTANWVGTVHHGLPPAAFQLRALWPNVQAALAWIDRYGDCDGDGFIEYTGDPGRALANQGWRDSGDAVFYEDGRLARGPIALCEAQGYAYAAKRHGARLARLLGEAEFAETLKRAAAALRQRFEEAFWMDERRYYALALDGEKRPCRIRCSSGGHLLFSGIVSPQRAAVLAAALTGREFFSGWGIRTIASGEPCYNPVSYHNGSVWPHDNAIIAIGLARYGHVTEALKIFRRFSMPRRTWSCADCPSSSAGSSDTRSAGPRITLSPACRRPGRAPHPLACSVPCSESTSTRRTAACSSATRGSPSRSSTCAFATSAWERAPLMCCCAATAATSR
jgi:hypothetical protein